MLITVLKFRVSIGLKATLTLLLHGSNIFYFLKKKSLNISCFHTAPQIPMQLPCVHVCMFVCMCVCVGGVGWECNMALRAQALSFKS